MSNEQQYMARALQLAEKGLFTTDPNPRVGCVIVKNDEIVGEGWHHKAGEAHAEVNALQQAGDAAIDATVYVTLEPCNHTGKTPPCSEALIEAGVKRVVVAMEDPNPEVSGRGIARLREAGIEVDVGMMQVAAEALNPGFIQRMKHGRPFVRSKLAMSLDGRTAMASGESKWITSDDARRDVHRLRARSSAIITGVGTVLADDPSLNVRIEGFDDAHQPMRVILDPYLSISPEAKMLGLPGRTVIISCCEEDGLIEPLVDKGAEVVCLPGGNGSQDLDAVMAYLAEQGVNEVLLETGATLSGAMLKAGLIDEMVFYMAPHLMGNQARGLFHLPGLEEMADRIELEILDMRAIGKDWRITARPKQA